MTLRSRQQLESTRTKLKLLEARYASSQKAAGSDHIQELSARSLKRLINQLKEEIARFESRAAEESTPR
jgi:hypothetical protein